MLTLNGTTQYAYWNGHTAPIQGQPNQNELGGVCGYPLWVCFDFRPATVAPGNQWTFSLADQFGSARQAGQLSSSTIKFNDGAAARSPHAGVQANVWQRVLFYKPSRASITTYLDGDPATEDTTDSAWPGANVLALGARVEGGNPPDLFFQGDFANVAIGSAILSPAQRAACIVGLNPLSMPGVARSWPLLANANDSFGAWNLTATGIFTSSGHPTVGVFPPVAGGSSGAPSHQLRRARI